MKKRYLYMFLPLLVLVLAGTAYGWQGRMGGMGDPYGLIADESDYLIHPAKIAEGQGTRLYGGYQFTFRGVDDSGFDADTLAGGIPVFSSRYFTDGDKQTHDISTGIAFPAGPGRMGIFVNYRLARGDLDGAAGTNTFPLLTDYTLKNQLDEFALRLLYGLPIGGGFKLGGELQLAYREEENKTELTDPSLGAFFRNNIFGSFSNPVDLGVNLWPFMTPYDSSYMEALFKGSVEGTVGPVAAAFTLRGGFLFGGKNEYSYVGTASLPGVLDMKGDVQGWRLGGDLWLRYPLAADLAIPFLMRFDYQLKTRDGEGSFTPPLTAFPFDYENKERSLDFETGGGVDMTLAKGTRAAGGIYYNYSEAFNSFKLVNPTVAFVWNRRNYPDSIAHRILLRLAGEHALTPAIDLQVGLNAFFGWVKEDYSYSTGFFLVNEDVSPDGHQWGIGGSLGATIRVFHGFALEPFLTGGYQESRLSGKGTGLIPPPVGELQVKKTTREWFTAAGLSILLDL
jgi:hypothetical protein